MTVWSYVDQVDISVLSDDRTFNDVHEASEALVQSFAELRRAAGFSGDPSVVDTAMAPARAGG
jgi:diacylglycerol O-acyltransferase